MSCSEWERVSLTRSTNEVLLRSIYFVLTRYAPRNRGFKRQQTSLGWFLRFEVLAHQILVNWRKQLLALVDPGGLAEVLGCLFPHPKDAKITDQSNRPRPGDLLKG